MIIVHKAFSNLTFISAIIPSNQSAKLQDMYCLVAKEGQFKKEKKLTIFSTHQSPLKPHAQCTIRMMHARGTSI